MTVHIASYAYGQGGHNAGCADGPTTIKNSPFLKLLEEQLIWGPYLQSDNKAQLRDAIPVIHDLCLELANYTAEKVRNAEKFLTLGGDHSSAIGTWSGVTNALNDPQDVGLIWFDAHMDSHTFETTPSNCIHGMPLALLLGYGDKSLTKVLTPIPKLLPQNVVLIGVRSYESGEERLLGKLGVKIFHMDKVLEEGIQSIMQQAIDIVTQRTQVFGISIDLDGIDPNDAPGVGCPVTNGVPAAEFIESLEAVAQDPMFIGAEIAEFNPHLDKEKKTEKVICEIIQKLF